MFVEYPLLVVLLPMLLGLKCNLEMTLARYAAAPPSHPRARQPVHALAHFVRSFWRTHRSRLSTAYHLGWLGTPNFCSRDNRVLVANLGVVQMQALVVSALATALATAYAIVTGGGISLNSM